MKHSAFLIFLLFIILPALAYEVGNDAKTNDLHRKLGCLTDTKPISELSLSELIKNLKVAGLLLKRRKNDLSDTVTYILEKDIVKKGKTEGYFFRITVNGDYDNNLFIISSFISTDDDSEFYVGNNKKITKAEKKSEKIEINKQGIKIFKQIIYALNNNIESKNALDWLEQIKTEPETMTANFGDLHFIFSGYDDAGLGLQICGKEKDL